MFKIYFILFYTLMLFSLSSSVCANDETDIQQAIDAYKERAWELGVSMGYGTRTNPLINSDDIPLYFVVNMAWFGDVIFFDNGDLGVNFYEDEQLSLNIISHINNERSLFEWFNQGVRIFGLPSAGSSPVDTIENDITNENPLDVNDTDEINPRNVLTEFEPSDIPTETTLINIPNRKIAVDAGLEILYSTAWGELQMQLLSDVSFRHKGVEIWGSYSYPWQSGRLLLTPSFGFIWKSQHLLNYYYGTCCNNERSSVLPDYQPNSGTNAFIRLAGIYHLTHHWSIVGVAEYEHLSRSIQNSLFVDKKNIQTYFIGLTYQF